MDIISKKQQELDLLMKEANQMLAEMQEIENMCASVSEKFNNIALKFNNNAKNIGGFAKDIAKAYGSKNSKAIGSIAEVGANIVGGAISLIGDIWANRKEKKLKEQLLPKKQDIANAKIGLIERLLPKFSSKKVELYKICKTEAEKEVDEISSESFEQIQKQFIDIFETYYIFYFLEETCKFFKAEFKAWLRGQHESNEIRKPANILYYFSVLELIEISNIPYKSSSLEFYTTLGTSVIFNNEKINAYANINDYFYVYSANIALCKISKNFDVNAKKFLDKFISTSYFVKNIKKEKNIKLYIFLIITLFSLIGIGFGYWFFERIINIFLFSTLFIVTGIVVSYFTKKGIEKNIENSRYSKIEEITGFDLETISQYN